MRNSTVTPVEGLLLLAPCLFSAASTNSEEAGCHVDDCDESSDDSDDQDHAHDVAATCKTDAGHSLMVSLMESLIHWVVDGVID